MNKLILMVVGTAAMVASQASPAHASLPNGLYGWTRTPDAFGTIDMVSISETDGHATLEFSVTIPNGYQALQLTYVPGGNFYGILRNGGSALLAEITPAGLITTHAYSGDAFVSPPEGIEYSYNESGIVISGGDNLYRVTPSGVVSDTRFMPLFDQDCLGANSLGLFGGELHVFDTNNPDAGYTMNRYDDSPGPFSGSPTFTHVYNGPVSNTESDLAINAFTNTIYTSGISSLLRFDLDAPQHLDDVGNYIHSDDIFGIAYVVPAPSALAALGLACGLLGRRRRRSPSTVR